MAIIMFDIAVPAAGIAVLGFGIAILKVDIAIPGLIQLY